MFFKYRKELDCALKRLSFTIDGGAKIGVVGINRKYGDALYILLFSSPIFYLKYQIITFINILFM